MTLTYDELLGQVRQLTPQERLALIEATTQMLKEEYLNYLLEKYS